MDIVEYAEAYAGIGFSSRPFNALDALVLSQLAYLPLELAGAQRAAVPISGLPALLGDVEPQMPAEFMLRHQLRLMQACAAGKRFGPLRLRGFVDEVDAEAGKQFSAVCAALPGGELVVAFRGTDLSLAGWQEDFRISYDSPVPAQRHAVYYLNEAARAHPGRLLLCGHSKGGNLAVYAAAFCGEAVQARVARVFSFDAPGQTPGVLETPEYQAIRKRIRAFLPERSVVGVLLQQTRPYTVVACRALGILQHNPFNWQIQGGAFDKRKALSARSLFLDKSLNTWITAMSRDERQQMTEAIFTILQAPGEEGFDDLAEDWMRSLTAMWKAAAQLPRALKKAVRRSASLLLSSAAEAIGEDVKSRASEFVQGIQQRFREFTDSQRDEDEDEPDSGKARPGAEASARGAGCSEPSAQ